MLSSELLRGIAPSPTSKTYHSPPAQINLHHGLKILAFSKRNSGKTKPRCSAPNLTAPRAKSRRNEQ
ncbi:hypothetical protein JHK82_047589 [Glycine max]|uniref:Uncharacterized protein n=2 Tax=Glycine subgen. Soja TaxID=1462606 RepID=K7MLT4_SOYBN|nr:hypothetical protein JHK86_047474 [Glycine max]KAG4933285.1 hypothetical protein JHK87_047287 [Glycine soja]KAG4943421.1 hypothetical protein JHK85_048067 [Glycine max]KAG5097735.1 hypothetical protein JHK82_047589 [Glycine max]KAG5102532.1 hypothetical protein JHK84_047501 [Glycine max]